MNKVKEEMKKIKIENENLNSDLSNTKKLVTDLTNNQIDNNGRKI